MVIFNYPFIQAGITTIIWTIFDPYYWKYFQVPCSQTTLRDNSFSSFTLTNYNDALHTNKNHSKRPALYSEATEKLAFLL